jgi:beta-phosphoglucomutase
MNRKLEACLFDMDGVIVDTAKFHFQAWARLADSLGIPFTEEQNEQLKGVSRIDSLEKILSWGNLFLNNAKKVELMELKNKWYLDMVAEIKPSEMLPGAHDLLLSLKSNNIKIGLGSSSRNSILILEKLGIISLFDVIIDGNKIHFSKPHPEVFTKGADQLGIQIGNIVVFEDAISGVEAAKNGGFYCIGVGSEEVLLRADHYISGLHEINVGVIVDLLSKA